MFLVFEFIVDDIAYHGSSKTKGDKKKTSMRRKIGKPKKKSNPKGKLICNWKRMLMYKTFKILAVVLTLFRNLIDNIIK